MKNVLIFLGGAAIGSVVTWKLVEKRYRDLADEEIKSVVDTFKSREEELKKKEKKVEEKEKNAKKSESSKSELQMKTHYDDTLDALSYATANNIKDLEEELINPKKEKTTKRTKPYKVIKPEEFGEKDGFDTKSWTYWNDDVLTDEFDVVIENPEKIIGDALKHFGEYEDDSVYVRNVNDECDYEILRSEKDFNS